MAIVDKDDVLVEAWTPPIASPPTGVEAREWAMLGWWALSDTAKYLQRGSLFEALERLSEARQLALRLFAVARRVPYPSFGLVSLLDFEPFELPNSLEHTYCNPTSTASVLASALATADMLKTATADAAVSLEADLATPWVDLAYRRLSAVKATNRPGGARP